MTTQQYPLIKHLGLLLFGGLVKYYELTCITKQGQDLDNIIKVIDATGGKIIEQKDIGNRRFTYPILKENSGFYFSFFMELEPTSLPALNRQLKNESSILRYLVVSKKSLPVAPTPDIDDSFEDNKSSKIEVTPPAVEIDAPVSEEATEIAKPQAELPVTTQKVKKIAKTEKTEIKEDATVKEEVTVKEEASEIKTAVKEKDEVTDKKAETEKEDKPVKKTPTKEKSIEKKIEDKAEIKKEEPAKASNENDEEERLRRLNEKLDEILKD